MVVLQGMPNLVGGNGYCGQGMAVKFVAGQPYGLGFGIVVVTDLCGFDLDVL